MIEVPEAPTVNEVEGNEETSAAAAAAVDGLDAACAEAVPVGGNADDGHHDNASAQDANQRIPPHIPLEPPEDCIAVTADRGVLKKVLEPGESDDKPSLHARCLIHYVGYLASSGEAFMNTRTDRETEEPTVVVAGRTAAASETGLCLAAATMSRGERALVYITDPAYGYGRLGSFSFPCVPPDSRLVYEVEMVNWEGIEETDNDRDRGSLLFEERLERAERRRETGNALFKEHKYKEALAKYAMALSYMDEDFMYQLEGHYLDKAEAIKLKIHLNMAAAQLKTGDFNTAIYNCGQVLNIDPNNVKALFRRAKARHALMRTEEALQDLDAALKTDPRDREILAEKKAVLASMKAEREAQAKIFRGQFKPSPTTPAQTTTAATTTTAAGQSSTDRSTVGADTTSPASAAPTGPEKRGGGPVAAAAASTSTSSGKAGTSKGKTGRAAAAADGVFTSLAESLSWVTRVLAVVLGPLLALVRLLMRTAPAAPAAAAAASGSKRRGTGSQRSRGK